MITVTLAWPSGERREILLAGVPRIGDHIRLRNGPGDQPLAVEMVMWSESPGRGREPGVIVAVRPVAP